MNLRSDAPESSRNREGCPRLVSHAVLRANNYRHLLLPAMGVAKDVAIRADERDRDDVRLPQPIKHYETHEGNERRHDGGSGEPSVVGYRDGHICEGHQRNGHDPGAPGYKEGW